MPKIPVIPITDRFSWIVPAKPYYLGMMIKWAVFSMGKKYGVGWPPSWVFVKDNEKAFFYNYQSDVENNGLKILAERYGRNGRLKGIKKEYDKIVEFLEVESDNINANTLIKLSEQEFIFKYNNFLDKFKEFWFRAVSAELSGYGSEIYLATHITDELFEDKADVVNILMKPSDYSFFQKEEMAMLKILSNIKINSKINKYSLWLKYLKNNKHLKSKIDRHAASFNWINNNYYSCCPEKKSFFYRQFWQAISNTEEPKVKLARIKKDFKIAEIKRSKLISRIPKGKLRFYAAQAGDSVAWHDDKKGRQLKFQRSLHYFLKDIARRYRLDFDKLLECTPDEVDKILVSKRLSLSELKKRKKLFVFHANKNKFEVLIGKSLESLWHKYQKTKISKTAYISGLTVSNTKSLTKGKVRLILDFKNINTMKQGEILVAEMTSPEYIVAIKKAKAIITDHGGMTCHAAIVSRELGIPCIVGTKIATRVLKNGDLVEVDANRGIVRKLK